MRRNIGQEGKKITEEKVTELPPELQVRLWPSHSVSVHLPWASVRCVQVIFNTDDILLKGIHVLKDWA